MKAMVFIQIVTTVIVNCSEKQDIDGATEQSTPPDGNIAIVRIRDGGSRSTFRSMSRYRKLSKRSPSRPQQPLLRQFPLPSSRQPLSRQPLSQRPLSRQSPEHLSRQNLSQLLLPQLEHLLQQPPQPLSRQSREPRRPGHPRRPPPGSYEKYRDVVPKGRYISGSSPFSRQNWRAYAIEGVIFGGIHFIVIRKRRNFSRHSSRQNEDMPAICTNKYEVRPDSTTGQDLGYFICPLPDLPDSDQFCCGPYRHEFCCNYTDAQYYYGRELENVPVWLQIVGTVIFLLVVYGCVIGTAVIKTCKHPRHYIGRLYLMFTSRGQHRSKSLPSSIATTTTSRQRNMECLPDLACI